MTGKIKTKAIWLGTQIRNLLGPGMETGWVKNRRMVGTGAN